MKYFSLVVVEELNIALVKVIKATLSLSQLKERDVV
jgi:hypothetical protein